MSDLPRWHVDRTVNLSVMLVLVLQTAGVFWWAATLQANLDQLQKEVDRRSPLVERYLQTENNVANIAEALEKIAARLEYLERK